MPVVVWVTEKDHQRHSNCKPEESVRLPLSAMSPPEDVLSMTVRNILDWLPSEIRNWDYSLL